MVYWLSGFTCMEKNLSEKAGAFRAICDNKVVLISSDTSPRRAGTTDEEFAAYKGFAHVACGRGAERACDRGTCL